MTLDRSRLMRIVYHVIAYLAAPFVFAFWFVRGLRDRAYLDRLGQRFGYGLPRPRAPAVWLHAVSVGEVQAAVPLVRALQQRFPGRTIVVTTVTPTGAERVRHVFGDEVLHCYVPFETAGAVRRFFDAMRPALALIIETELWPNLYAECGRRGIPLVLASARISPRSVKRYRRLVPLFREALSHGIVIAAQSEADAERFRELGAAPERTFVTGNIKFDYEPPEDLSERGAALRAELFGERPVWIAASTHAQEEEQVLDAHERLLESQPSLTLILVPRHPQRFDQVAQLIERRGLAYRRRTRERRPAGSDETNRRRAGAGNDESDVRRGAEGEGAGNREGGAARGERGRNRERKQVQGHDRERETTVYLGDTMGELPMFYGAADIAFVGGSLVPVGGHNLLEPAALGLSIITGPYLFNAEEIAALFAERGAAVVVEDAAALAREVQRLYADGERRARMGARARGIVRDNRGALERLMNLLEPLTADFD